ncbi:MAG: glycosyltransferase family 2 protein [Phycisphaerae bacterium]
MPTISVVLPTFNGGPLFAQVLAALKRQHLDAPPELLIIDSGSTDNTLSLAKDAGAKILQIPQSEFNHGLTRNRAIEATTGDIIILLTQDALPADEHLLANLAKPFGDPQVAGAFARQIPRPEHDVLIQRNINNWVAGSLKPRISQITDRAAFDKLPPMERYLFCVFDNVCSAIRRSVWQQIPLRANEFGEDLDWSKRALEAGWKIAYEPTAAVIHSHDRATKYEYKRTYMCHRTLYRLFGLQTIPEKKYVTQCLVGGIKSELAYVWKHQPGLLRKLSLSLKIPFLVNASVKGQYHGARDERLQQGVRQEGV